MHRCITDPAAGLQPGLALRAVAVGEVCAPPAGDTAHFQLESCRLQIDSSMKAAKEKMR